MVTWQYYMWQIEILFATGDVVYVHKTGDRIGPCGNPLKNLHDAVLIDLFLQS